MKQKLKNNNIIRIFIVLNVYAYKKEKHQNKTQNRWKY